MSLKISDCQLMVHGIMPGVPRRDNDITFFFLFFIYFKTKEKTNMPI